LGVVFDDDSGVFSRRKRTLEDALRPIMQQSAVVSRTDVMIIKIKTL
jgi:hypothetical protein